jgi:hypothetical protein
MAICPQAYRKTVEPFTGRNQTEPLDVPRRQTRPSVKRVSDGRDVVSWRRRQVPNSVPDSTKRAPFVSWWREDEWCQLFGQPPAEKHAAAILRDPIFGRLYLRGSDCVSTPR